MQVRIDRFNVVQWDWLSKKLLVEGKTEAAVKMKPVEQGNANDPTNKTEVWQMVLEKQTEY